MTHYSVQVIAEDFDFASEVEKIRQRSTNFGALSSFIGYVRADTKQSTKVAFLQLEHYQGMTQSSLATIAKKAAKSWQVDQISITHRVGKLAVNEQIVLVLCTAPKRLHAISACEFIIHQLKVRAPFWKKEIYENGSEQWIEQNQQDLILSDRAMNLVKD